MSVHAPTADVNILSVPDAADQTAACSHPATATGRPQPRHSAVLEILCDRSCIDDRDL
jgi:hypothetical protein